MKLVTYNIQFGRGRDARFDLGRIAEAVRGADVIALQEVERYFKRSGLTDQVAELVRRLPGYHWVYGPGIDVGIDPDDQPVLGRRMQFGNLLLSRSPILSSRNHLLPKVALVDHLSIQRAALEGVIAFPRGPARVYSVHLAHVSALERRRQIAHLLAILRAAPGEGGAWSGGADSADWADAGVPPPMAAEAILMGNFNLTPDSPEYEVMAGPREAGRGRIVTEDGFVDAWIAAGNDPEGGQTCPGSQGGHRIDFVFVAAGLAGRVRAARVDEEAPGSDHQPLWAEIDL